MTRASSSSASAELWIGLAEVEPVHDGHGELLDRNGAFTNIIAWCASAEEFRRHAEGAALAKGLRVVEVEDVEPVVRRGGLSALDAGMHQLGLDVAEDRKPRLGTLHTWTHEG